MARSLHLAAALRKDSMIIRPVEEQDIAAMARIRAAEWADEAFWVDRITRYKQGIHMPQHALLERALFVAVDADVIGLIAGHKTTRLGCDGELQWLNVAAEKRGLGISGLLIAQMGDWFIQQKIHKVCVNVDVANEPARSVYARCGAHVLNDHWMLWHDTHDMHP